MNKLNSNGCLNLAIAVIGHCFSSIYIKDRLANNGRRIKKIRCNFANRSKLLRLFSDCSDNFETEKLKKEIIKFNK